jgi:hypothetical protein
MSTVMKKPKSAMAQAKPNALAGLTRSRIQMNSDVIAMTAPITGACKTSRSLDGPWLRTRYRQYRHTPTVICRDMSAKAALAMTPGDFSLLLIVSEQPVVSFAALFGETWRSGP